MNDKSPRGSESTREMRDTARRRRDSEEKLQQHLLEARGHVPNEYNEPHAADADGTAPDTGAADADTADAGDPGSGHRDAEGA
ncbi:hypothetical protein HWD94_20130 [Pseudarthrobacter equi]|uniref:hypothetical protein n=1 Tax=Pseudarthrobacter equi TaxID=728066 RepID=UPI0021BE3A5A|nr:hypothetical protein [Pseudarthrobacter equi]MCT9627405.1 hypothetical protein [Pseudarthrobacter equi]